MQKPLVSDLKPIFSNQYRLESVSVVMDNIETLHKKKWLLKTTLVSYSKQTCLNHYRSSKELAVRDNIETFYHKRIVAAEAVGFVFEADVFESAPMFLGWGCHGQH